MARDEEIWLRCSGTERIPASREKVWQFLAATSPDETELTWSADVVVHGTIASIGARLLDGFAKKQAEQFFRCIRNQLSDGN